MEPATILWFFLGAVGLALCVWALVYAFGGNKPIVSISPAGGPLKSVARAFMDETDESAKDLAAEEHQAEEIRRKADLFKQQHFGAGRSDPKAPSSSAPSSAPG